ncbi:hypothetical protein C0991_009154 [Blastosporella zonata]|nr:hypothetical protein C0991_009154 [Blastosporella zonata]
MSRYPDYLSPNVTPTKLTKTQKSRARREPSGVFSLFKAPQIQQFKEAFQLIDHDKDGWVSESDLKEIFSSLGITPSKQMLDDLLSARPGGGGRLAYSEDRGINFTMFLTMMSERLFEFDTESELLEAFESFDENDSGIVKVEEMRKWLSEVGERMDSEEIDRLLKGSFTDRQGNFNYREWVKSDLAEDPEAGAKSHPHQVPSELTSSPSHQTPQLPTDANGKTATSPFPTLRLSTIISATTTSAVRAQTTSASLASGRTAEPPAQSVTILPAISERPQDLKKHEKIHTEEHHQQHKHSKAITVVDPVYISRVRGESATRTLDSKSNSSKPSSSTSNLRGPTARSKSHSSTGSDGTSINRYHIYSMLMSSLGSHLAILSTPSPELDHSSIQHPHSHDHFLQNQQLSWENVQPVSTGSKRSHDYIDEFFTDMKKRRMNPSYDSREQIFFKSPSLTSNIWALGMAQRLEDIAYSHSNSQPHGHSNNFNPRSVSLDIRTPAELAAVNEFLVTLGRDVSSGRHPAPQPSHPPPSSAFPTESYFDAVSLGQLGLAGMPGIPSTNSNFQQDHAYSSPTTSASYSGGNSAYHLGRPSHPSVPNQYGSMYGGGINDPSSHYNHDYAHSRRISSKYAPTSSSSYPNQYHHHSTPPLDSGSPHSTLSTPVNTTPPQVSLTMPDAIIDYLHGSRGAPPVPHLARPDFMSKTMRTIVPLKSVPGAHSRPEPMEPKVLAPRHRGSPAKLTSASASSTTGHSLYPLLTDGDAEFKLPPMHRSYSPPSRESTPSTVSRRSPSPIEPTTLPSLSSIAPPPLKARSHEADNLTKLIERIELENSDSDFDVEDRKRHARLILDLVISINRKFRSDHPDAF